MEWIDNARVQDLASMVLVGALWGCTNPFLRKGSVESEKQQIAAPRSFLKSSLLAFLNVQVWLPYLLNQSGSIMFYILLANSDLSLAVPICNALALVFSFATSVLLGESIDKPLRSFLGAALVLLGVTICVSSQGEEEEGASRELS
jgi:Putative transmembrane family 234